MKDTKTFLLVVALGIYATVATFMVPDAKTFADPSAARIVIAHVPCAISTVIWMLVATVYAWKVLKGEAAKEPHLRAAWDLTTIFALLALGSGIIFSGVQWGALWHWDPRQTSFLLVTMIVLAGLALRNAQPEPERRRKVTAGFTLATILPNLFLIFVLPRLPQVNSFHPSTTIAKREMDAAYSIAMWSTMAVVVFVATALYRLRVSMIEAQNNLEIAHANLNSSHVSDHAPRAVAVARPVSSGDGVQAGRDS